MTCSFRCALPRRVPERGSCVSCWRHGGTTVPRSRLLTVYGASCSVSACNDIAHPVECNTRSLAHVGDRCASTGNMGSMETLSSNLENRIVRYDEAVDPEQLTAHPLNFRRHPVAQRKALRASIEGHGWVAPVIATVDGTVIDGHARVEEALSGGVTVPVVFVDMDDDEAGSMILRLDPIAAMASHDSDVLGELLAREEWVADESALSETLGAVLAKPVADPGSGGIGDIDLDGLEMHCPTCGKPA